MGYVANDLREAVNKMTVAFDETLNDRDLDQEVIENLKQVYAEMMPQLEKIKQIFANEEEKEDKMIFKFCNLSDEKQISIIEAALPDHKICPISQVNEYIKNELNGDFLKFMRACEGDPGDYDTHYVEIVDNSKYFEVFTINDLSGFLNDDDVIDYIKKHPKVLEA